MAASRHEMITRLRSPEMTRRLRASGTEPPLGPDPDLIRMCKHLGEAWREADVAWRTQALRRLNRAKPVADEWREIVSATAALAAPLIADAEVISLPPTFASMVGQTTRAEALDTLLVEQLPWTVVWLEIAGKAAEAPVLVTGAFSDGVERDFVLLGVLCIQLPQGMAVQPYIQGTDHAGQPFGSWMPQLNVVPDLTDAPMPAGAAEVTAAGQARGDRAIGLVEVSATASTWVAATLQVLSAINVSVEPRQLSGKARRRWERERHPLPHTVVVRRHRRAEAEGAEASAEGSPLSHQHMVRGHWMHITRGPVFNANPDARRWIPGLEKEAVRIWRSPHMRGPADTPMPRTILRIEATND